MILVTGATGLVGSHLLFELLKNSTETIRATYRKNSNIEHLKTVFSYYVKAEEASKMYDKIEWHEADILDIPALAYAFKNITHVYHCAAMISYNVRDAKQMRKVNIEGTANVVNFCVANNITKLCYVSSIAALGSSKMGIPIDEDTLWNAEAPHSAYAWSKYGGEMEVWRGSQEGLDVVIVNPGVIIGPGFWDSGSGLLFKKVKNGLSYSPTLTTGFVGINDVVLPMTQLMKASITNERYVLVAESLPFIEVANRIGNALNTSKRIKPLKSWMITLGWIFQSIGFVFGGKKTITYDNIKGLFNISIYDNNKLKKTLNYEFKDVKSVIQNTVLLLNQ